MCTYTNLKKYYHFGCGLIITNISNDLNNGTPPTGENIHSPELKTTSSINSDFCINNILLGDIGQVIPIILTPPSKETHAVIAMKEQRENSHDTIKHSFLNDYIKSLQDQIERLKSEVCFLRGELKGLNEFPTLFNIGSDNKSQQTVYGNQDLRLCVTTNESNTLPKKDNDKTNNNNTDNNRDNNK